ncbi:MULTISPECIES: YncE family protein [unclassified Saccharicrinis]|uniref:YncE family protein n=1 Tax=unclassified Saccharicrinis TaxID=2646859 RepID=UPI003D33FFF2
MKNKIHIPAILTILIAFVSCDKDYPDIISNDALAGVFVGNEGGTVSFYNERDSSVTADMYNEVNSVSLGGKLTAFSVVGNRGYILKGSAGAQEIDLVDMESFISIGSENGFSNLTDLKAVSDQFLYATQGTVSDGNSGSVLIMDSTAIEIGEPLRVGKNPTRIAYSKGKKLYVANTGGQAYPDSTVMVIDITLKEVTDTIALEQELDETTTLKLKTPVEMVIDGYRNIWVLCVGLNGEGAGLARINYGTHEVKVFPFVDDYVANGRNCLMTSLGGGTIFYVNDGTYAMRYDDDELPANKFFKEETYKSMVFDAMAINPYTGKYFCAVDGQGEANGSVFIFDRYAYNSENTVFEVGVMPRHFVFVR